MNGARYTRAPTGKCAPVMTWANDELRQADHGYPTGGQGRERGSQSPLGPYRRRVTLPALAGQMMLVSHSFPQSTHAQYWTMKVTPFRVTVSVRTTEVMGCLQLSVMTS
jgi:hypothetical protein